MGAQELYSQIFKRLSRADEVTSDARNSVAIGILLGGGSYEASNPRLSEVPWETLTNKVWVAGTRNDPHYNFREACTLLGGVPPNIKWQGCRDGLNTVDQMKWLTECLLQDTEVTTLVLSTSCYHLPRCVLTFVKTWMDSGDSRKLQLALLPTSDPVPKGLTTTNQTIEGELERIAAYQNKGDVATADEFFNLIRRSTT